jgi:thiamine-monophosphate kinase
VTRGAGEADWIEVIRAAFSAVGAYDAVDDDRDAHLLAGAGRAFLNVDAHVAGRHYPWPCPRPQDAGYRGVVAALSDLAAVGARPADLFLSLAFNSDTPAHFLHPWIAGMADAAARWGLRLRGGNLTWADRPTAHTVVAGSGAVRAARGPLLPGDSLWLTGTQGDAALALALDPQGAAPSAFPELAARFWRPEPRLAWGRALWRRPWIVGVSDVSDGWLRTLAAMPCQGGLSIDPDAVPRSAAYMAADLPSQALADSYWGGEDWELAFAARGIDARDVRRSLRRAKIPAAHVGTVISAPGITFASAPALAPPPHFGYDCLTPPA